MSNPPCERYPAGTRLELRIRHILPFLLDSVGVIVRIVSFGLTLSDWYSLMVTLFLMVVVSPGPSSHVADLPLPHMLVSCFVVLVHHLGVQRVVHTFLMHFSVVSDAACPPRTPSLSESFSLILQLFNLNLGSTPQPLASLLRHSSSQPEASRCFARNVTDRCLFQTSVAHRHVLYIVMISRNTSA